MHFVDYDLGDGETLRIQLNQPPMLERTDEEGGPRYDNLLTDKLGKPVYHAAQYALDKALDMLLLMPRKVIERVKKLEDQPDEIEMKLTCGFEADGRIYVAEVSAAHSLEVTLKWTKR